MIKEKVERKILWKISFSLASWFELTLWGQLQKWFSEKSKVIIVRKALKRNHKSMIVEKFTSRSMTRAS